MAFELKFNFYNYLIEIHKYFSYNLIKYLKINADLKKKNYFHIFYFL